MYVFLWPMSPCGRRRMEPTVLTQQLDQSAVGEAVDDVGAAVAVAVADLEIGGNGGLAHVSFGGSYTYGEGVGDGDPCPARFSEAKKAIGVHCQ